MLCTIGLEKMVTTSNCFHNEASKWNEMMQIIMCNILYFSMRNTAIHKHETRQMKNAWNALIYHSYHKNIRLLSLGQHCMVIDEHKNWIVIVSYYYLHSSKYLTYLNSKFYIYLLVHTESADHIYILLLICPARNSSSSCIQCKKK